jgi:hypothetical protein
VAVPHLVINGFKNVLAIALGTEYSFPQADKARKTCGTTKLVYVHTPCHDKCHCCCQPLCLRSLMLGRVHTAAMRCATLTPCVLSRVNAQQGHRIINRPNMITSNDYVLRWHT